MALYGAKTKDLYVGREHICGFPTICVGMTEKCDNHMWKENEPWGECGFRWGDGEELDRHTDAQWLEWKVKMAQRMEEIRRSYNSSKKLTPSSATTNSLPHISRTDAAFSV
jgi:hypothetical protein